MGSLIKKKVCILECRALPCIYQDPAKYVKSVSFIRKNNKLFMSPGKVVLSLEKLEITRFKKNKDF